MNEGREAALAELGAVSRMPTVARGTLLQSPYQARAD